MKKLKWFVKEGDSFTSIETLPETLEEAFDKSIEAWGLRAKGSELDCSLQRACGLCNLFLDGDCFECPVKEETGLSGCDNNKYFIDWYDHRTKANAKAEQDWLIKLKKKYCKKPRK